MSKKYWDGEVYMSTDWGGDESTSGRPLTGKAVQTFIKSELTKLDNEKVGYITEEDGTVYFSSSKEAYESGKKMGAVNSMQKYALYVEKDPNNRTVFLSGDSNKTYTWYFKTEELASKTVIEERVSVEYHIENITNKTSKVISTVESYISKEANSSGFMPVTIENLDTMLENGVSQIEIIVKGLRTKLEKPINDKITIVTLNISDETDFSKPFTNSIIVSTSINCTKGQPYFYEYRFNDESEFTFNEESFEGDGRNITRDLTIDISNLPDGKHVFEYRIFINLGAEMLHYTPTQRIEFIKGPECKFEVPQILIFTSYSDGQFHVKDNGDLIVNGASQYLPFQIKYAVYNTDASTTNVEFYDITENSAAVPTSLTVNRGSFAYYSIQSMTSGETTVKIICKDIENRVIEGSDRIIYINVAPSILTISEFKRNLRINFSSVDKDNNSLDKDTWVSEVKEGNFVNTAKFSDTFDWSQGWTNNGLVISKGCEVEFDYIPFPEPKDSPTPEEAKEYVGGPKNGYTFEIEFMTQNVTNESAVLCNMVNENSDENDCGLLITGSEIRFTTPNHNSVSSRFKEGDMNRAVIVVHPETIVDNNGETKFRGLVELYMNGILSNIAKYEDDKYFTVLERDETGNFRPKPLRFTGSEDADIVIKYIRAYNTIMTPDEVVNNYIIYRNNATEMLKLYNKNNVLNSQGEITPDSMLDYGNIPILIFVGRTVEGELASGCGNVNGYDGTDPDHPDGYLEGTIEAKSTYWYRTLEETTDKNESVHMDVIYYNPLDKRKNFKFVKAYIRPQGTSSMYYPKKNYRIYTQKNSDTRIFFSRTDEDGNLIQALELDQMLVSNFGEKEEDRIFEPAKLRGTDKKVVKKKLYSFKDNAQPVKCWCLKADFAETSSSHNTGIARLWGETLKTSTVSIKDKEYPVFKTNAQATIETLYNNNINGDMPDIRTTIDGFPIVVFGMKSYKDECVFLGKYNFNNDKSTESVFGFCDIDDENDLTDTSYDYENNISGTEVHTLDKQLDQYMSCVETLDNGNILANFASMESEGGDSWEDSWEDAFEFRYPEITEEPDPADYQDGNGTWVDKEGYDEDYAQYEIDLEYWKNTHLKPFKHFAQWIYDTRWCDVNGNILTSHLEPIAQAGTEKDESGNTLTTVEAIAEYRKRKFATEKWEHIDVWKMAAYYIYAMRFGAVDQIVKNSMLTSEGPFAYNKDGVKYGNWDSTDVNSPLYGRYYKWYYINYDNDTIMGVKNDGSLKYGPEITRQDVEGEDGNVTPIYAGQNSSLWNNIEYDDEFQDIIRIADRGISRTMTYKKAIDMFEVEQVGKWCERIYNKDAEYKYISPYMGTWTYTGDTEDAVIFSERLDMLQGSRTAHRRWWLSRRFNLLDGRWSSGDFATKYIEVKCDYGSIGDKFSAIAGANAYFGYQINNRTFGDAAGGVTQEYKSGEKINWELKKVINIGDPIAIYGSNDLLELDLGGISKNLASVTFNFGSNTDLGNKLEHLNLSLPDSYLFSNASYTVYADDEVGTTGGQTGFEKIKAAYPFAITSEDDFGPEGLYPTVTEQFDPSDATAPKFYRVESVNDKGDTVYTYFAKVDGGVRNYACKGITLDSLNKLQSLSMAGYMSLKSLDLSKNKFISDVDIRYSGVGSVAFGSGSRIKTFKASDKLSTLAFNSCDNITLSSIFINSSELRVDGGRNITTIEVVDSSGLNHSNDFKTFIIKWMKTGDVSSKSLVLRGVKWTNVKIDELKNILEFKTGNEYGKHARQCVITGTIEMGPEKITADDLEMFDELINILGGSITIKIPYANIILNKNKGEIVAGESIKYTYSLFPDAQSIIEQNGIIDYYFVREVTSQDDYDERDGRTNKYYKIIRDSNEVREGVRLVKGENDNELYITTTENAVGSDTQTYLMVRLTIGGDTNFDIAPLLIKEPTYAVSGSITGLRSIGDKNKDYTYTLSITSNTGEEPIGTMDIIWAVSGTNYDTYLSNLKISDDKRTYTITTSEEQPYPTGELTIIAKVINHDASSDVYPAIPKEVFIYKDILLLNERVVLTEETNEVVFNVCKEQGWATMDNFVMTREEAEAVTDIGNAFANVKAENGWSFEEFRYFTNPNLNHISSYAFENSDITSISFPDNVLSLGNGVFKNCEKLKEVHLSSEVNEITEECFMNCSSLVNFELPDNVTRIKQYAFGGTYIEQIAEKTNVVIEDNHAILITRNSKLEVIENDAFETEKWSPGSTTNALKEILIPNRLSLGSSYYNFTLSKNLKKIELMSEEDSTLLIKDNILYANKTMTNLVRAIAQPTDDNVKNYVFIENAAMVYHYAFFNCKTIKEIEFGSNMEMYGLGIGAFYGSSIEIIDLRPCTDLIELQEYTFAECENLIEVKFPDNASLAYFGCNLFINCPSLKTLTLPNTLVSLKGDENANDSNTFIKCGFEEFIMPQSLVSAGRFFLNECNNLKKVVFSDFYKLGQMQIVNCSAITEVILPIFTYSAMTYIVKNGDEIIGEFSSYTEAQNACIENCIIVEEQRTILVNERMVQEAPAFDTCPNILTYKLNAKDNNEILVESDGVLYRVGKYNTERQIVEPALKELHAVPYGMSALTIDEDTKVIGGLSTNGCEKITKIVVPEGVIKLGGNAFNRNGNNTLVEVILPESLEEIGEGAFKNVTEMKELVIPKKVTILATSMLQGCSSLETLVVEGEVTKILSFALVGCTNLSSFTLYAKVAPELEIVDEYHPFGYKSYHYVGVSNKGHNVLYVPYGNEGYDSDVWKNPLFDETKCGFRLEEISLPDTVLINAYNNGEIITDGPIYFVSESGDLVFSEDNSVRSSTYNVSKGGFVLNFNNKVYQNEIISVYSDSDLTNKIGEFVAEHGKTEYVVGAIMSYATKRNIFSTTLFGSPSTNENNTGNEIVSITKKEYETLISKINQLTEIIDNLK